MKHHLGQLARRVQKLIIWCLGGFLPEALSHRTTLVSSAVAAILLTAFSSNVLGLTAGLVITFTIWLSEEILALTSKPSSLARHATISVSYMFLLSIGIGATYSTRTDYLPWLVWLSLLLLGLCVWLTSSLPVLLSTPLLSATNFKNNPELKDTPRIQVKGLLRVTWAVFAVIAILTTFSSPATPWVALVLTCLTAAVTLPTVAKAWRYADHARWKTLRELKRMKPKIVVPYGGTATYQAEMWYPYLDQLEEPYFIVSLTEGTMDRLAKNTKRPIVVPDERTVADVRHLVPDSVKIAYYPHNSAKNSLFRADRRYTHVFVHHGDGDKAPSFNPNSAKYDLLFVAGQGAIDRYKTHGVEIPRSKFRIIGRPPTESIVVDRTPISEKSRPTVLYAPTWRGKNAAENYSSLPLGIDIVKALIQRDVNVLFRPHPASRSSKEYSSLIDVIYSLLEDDSLRSERKHIWGKQAETDWSVSDVTNASDAMIADVSGIVTDYLQSAKPYAMATLRFSVEDFKKQFPTSQPAYVITGTEESLSAALDEMLGNDPLEGLRLQKREYFLGGYEGRQAVDKFLSESRKIIQA